MRAEEFDEKSDQGENVTRILTFLRLGVRWPTIIFHWALNHPS